MSDYEIKPPEIGHPAPYQPGMRVRTSSGAWLVALRGVWHAVPGSDKHLAALERNT